MTVDDSKSYLGYLNKLVKLVDEYNNICHRSIGNKLMIVNLILVI